MIKTKLVGTVFETTAGINAEGKRYVTYRPNPVEDGFTINGVNYTGSIDVIEQPDRSWRFMPSTWRKNAYSHNLTAAARRTLKGEAVESATKFADFHPEAFHDGMATAQASMVERLTNSANDFRQAAKKLDEFVSIAELFVNGVATLSTNHPVPHSVRWDSPQYRHYGAALIDDNGGCEVKSAVMLHGELIGFAVNGSASSLLLVPLGLVTATRESWSKRYVNTQ